jgi:hypothetical protein
MRVLQGNGLGAVLDAARADTDAQRHDAGPARRQDALRQMRQAPGAILSCEPERHARVCSKLSIGVENDKAVPIRRL